MIICGHVAKGFVTKGCRGPLSLSDGPRPCRFGGSRSSKDTLCFTLVPAFLSSSRFGRGCRRLGRRHSSNFPSLPGTTRATTILYSGICHEVHCNSSLPVKGVGISAPTGNILRELAPLGVRGNICTPARVVRNAFRMLGNKRRCATSTISVPGRSFISGCVLSGSQALAPRRRSAIPVLRS